MSARLILGTNLVLATAGLVWVLWYWGAPALAVLAGPSLALLAGFLATLALAVATFAARWAVLLRAVGAREGLVRLVTYRLAGQSVSSLVPSAKLGGDPLRAYLLIRRHVPAPATLASVALDRTLEMGSGAIFAFLFAAVLVQRGVPALQGAFVTVSVGLVATCVGLGLMARRLRQRAGVVTAVASATGLDRLDVVRAHMDTLEGAERLAADVVERPRVLWGAFAVGVAANLLVLLEYYLLLRAFGLPASFIAVVAAIFATGAAHAMPVPAGVGVLEGGQMFLFGALGYPAEVGLAVGLAVRVRELCWVLPGLVYVATDALWSLAGRRATTAPARKPE